MSQKEYAFHEKNAAGTYIENELTCNKTKESCIVIGDVDSKKKIIPPRDPRSEIGSTELMKQKCAWGNEYAQKHQFTSAQP